MMLIWVLVTRNFYVLRINWFFIWIFFTTIRFIYIEIFLDAPVTKLVKCDTATSICINRSKIFPWILQYPNPFLQKIFSFNEFLNVQNPVTTWVNNFESLKVFVSLTKSNKEYSKFNSFDKFVFHRNLSLLLFVFRFFSWTWNEIFC